MFFHNNALTSSHPYASQPIQWPFLLRGVSFWTHNDTRQQIYFVGNPIGWWLASSLLAVFAGIVGADQLSLRRGVDSLEERKFNRPAVNSNPRDDKQSNPSLGRRHSIAPLQLHGILLPLLGGPLPTILSHGPSALPPSLPPCPSRLRSRHGALLEFIFNIEPLDITADSGNSQQGTSTDQSVIPASKKGKSASVPRRNLTAQERLGGQSMLALWAAAGVVMAVVIGGWWFFLPLTYGKPGLSAEQVLARKWLGYDLHFAK